MSRKHATFFLLLTPLLLFSTIHASTNSVTRGTFRNMAVATAENMHLWGHAQLVRADDKTILTAHIVGLKPDHAYQAEVHKKPNCAGGDYELNGQEIEADFITNHEGIGHAKTTVDGLAGSEAGSVVVEDPNDNRLACATLN